MPLSMKIEKMVKDIFLAQCVRGGIYSNKVSAMRIRNKGKKMEILKIFLTLQLFAGLTMNVIGQQSHSVMDFGALGDGQTIDTEAIQKAVNQCYADSGGVVFFPPGTYISGTLHLKSNVTLHIGEGATLKGSNNLGDYQLQPDTAYTSWASCRYIFIHCVDMNNVSIKGKGTIDGARVTDDFLKKNGRGPMAVLFENTDNVFLDEITVRNSANWAVTFLGCKGVVAKNVKVLDSRFDGINPVSSSDVLLEGCIIDGSGDDPIAIKNEGNPLCGHITQNIIIRNCIIRNTGHSALKFGTGTAGVFRNIQITGCIIENTGPLFSIQLMRPSLDINKERALENVMITDIIAKDVNKFIDITTIGVDKPVIRNLRFKNILIDGERNGSRIIGTPEAPIRDIVIDNVSSLVKGKRDSWLLTDNVNGLILRDLDLRFNENSGSLLDFENGTKLRAAVIDASGIQGQSALFKLNRVKDAKIQAIRTSHRFPEVEVKGSGSEGIFLYSDFPLIGQPVIVSQEVKPGNIYPAAKNVEILGIIQPGIIKAGEQAVLNVKLRNNGLAGIYRLQVLENKLETGSRWIWLEQNQAGEFLLDLKPHYYSGKYEVEVGGVPGTIDVLTTPARIETKDTLKIVNGPVDKLKVILAAQNTGGEKGNRSFKMVQNGKIADQCTVELAPGEIKDIELISREIENTPLSLKVEDFPEWKYQVASTTPSDFFFTKDGQIIIDAGGRLAVHEDYGTVYINDVEGDFDAIVKIRSQQPTGEYASIGLIVRNELTDTASNGFMGYTKSLKYGGYTTWRKDLDGDGKFDHNSSEGGKEKWFKICKRGETFSLEVSGDGKEWHKSAGYTINSAKRIQDVGVFGNAYNDKAKNRVTFEYFKVFPLKN